MIIKWDDDSFQIKIIWENAKKTYTYKCINLICKDIRNTLLHKENIYEDDIYYLIYIPKKSLLLISNLSITKKINEILFGEENYYFLLQKQEEEEINKSDDNNINCNMRTYSKLTKLAIIATKINLTKDNNNNTNNLKYYFFDKEQYSIEKSNLSISWNNIFNKNEYIEEITKKPSKIQDYQTKKTIDLPFNQQRLIIKVLYNDQLKLQDKHYFSSQIIEIPPRQLFENDEL